MDGGNVGRVLVVSDEPERARELAAALTADDLKVQALSELAAACASVRREHFDVVVADLWSPDFSCVALLRCAASAQPPARVVCMFGAAASSRTTWLAIREAAFACLRREAGASAVREQVQAALDAHLELTQMYQASGGSRAVASTASREGGRGEPWR